MSPKKKTTVAELRNDLVHTFSMRVSQPLHDRIVRVLDRKGNGNASDYVRTALVEKLERDELEEMKLEAERAKYRLK